MTGGWDESAKAWIDEIRQDRGFGRPFVLDPVMIQRLGSGRFASALDVGCGEGRFCRMMAERGIKAVGIDPTSALLEEARRRDPDGDYRMGRAERVDFPDAQFDLVVSYLSLIDIPDMTAAISEMCRVLKPGGSLLIANLNSFVTARGDIGWVRDGDGRNSHMVIDDYLGEHAYWASWRGIRIVNWHRPLSAYMASFLGHGLELVFFDEPAARGGPERKAEEQRRVPYFVVMEWRKPKGVDPS